MKDNIIRKNLIPTLYKVFIAILMLICVVLIGGWGFFDKKLPESTGKDVNTLKAELEAMNREFIIEEEFEFNENIKRGLVSRLEPASGTRVKKGTTVTIYIKRKTNNNIRL